MAIRFSDVLEHMGPSDLGPLLALTAQPDIIPSQAVCRLRRPSR